jgi:hypothetical protein
MSTSNFSRDQLETLARFLLKTQPVELTCDEWLEAISPYAEAVLTQGPLPENASLIEHHLDICTECKEEFDALLQAMCDA